MVIAAVLDLVLQLPARLHQRSSLHSTVPSRLRRAPGAPGEPRLVAFNSGVSTDKGERRVSVEKSIDLTATGPTIEQAVEEAVGRAKLTLRGVTSFEIERIDGLVGEEDIAYRVLVRVSFVVKEHVHE